MLFVIGSDSDYSADEDQRHDDSELEVSVQEAPAKKLGPTWSQPRFVIIAVMGLIGGVLGAVFLPGLMEQISDMLNREGYIPYRSYGYTYPAMALLGLILGSGLGRLFVQLVTGVAYRLKTMDVGDRVDLILGGFAGIVASIPFLFIFQGVAAIATPFLFTFLIVGFSAVSIYALRSLSEVLPWHKGVSQTRRTGIKVLDTNVLIDGRLYDLIRTGFLEGEMYLPNFVLEELQDIADASDSLRRQRGRRGLEVLRRIQSENTVKVGVYDKHAADDREKVDARLVRIAKAIGGDLVTNDYNLNKVASIQNVQVLNINDLALALRPAVLPGEMLEVTIIREGSQYGQGVGYLDDGTMVVVENGRDSIGQTTEVAVSQVIQTERGKMIFASIDDEEEPPRRRR